MRTRHSGPAVAQLRRRPRLPVWIGAIALLASACGHHTPVQTAVAPDAHVVRLRNFTVLQPQGVANAPASADPVVRNPATIHTISFELLLAFQARGYFADTAAPDFAVAYYIGEHMPFDTSVFKYPYPFAPYTWWRDSPAVLQASQSPSQGILIVDVISPKTKALLWRGEAVVPLPADRSAYVEALQNLADAIAGKFQAGLGTGPIAPAPLPHGGRPGQ
jgi:hypothetical protein